MQAKVGPLVLTVSLADTPSKKMAGYMHKDSISESEGILFTGLASGDGFHMHYVKFPLAIAFLDEHKRILARRLMEPNDGTTSAPMGTRFALECHSKHFELLAPGAYVNLAVKREAEDRKKEEDEIFKLSERMKDCIGDADCPEAAEIKIVGHFRQLLSSIGRGKSWAPGTLNVVRIWNEALSALCDEGLLAPGAELRQEVRRVPISNLFKGEGPQDYSKTEPEAKEYKSLEQLAPASQTISSDWLLDEYAKAKQLKGPAKKKRIDELKGLSKHLGAKHTAGRPPQTFDAFRRFVAQVLKAVGVPREFIHEVLDTSYEGAGVAGALEYAWQGYESELAYEKSLAKKPGSLEFAFGVESTPDPETCIGFVVDAIIAAADEYNNSYNYAPGRTEAKIEIPHLVEQVKTVLATWNWTDPRLDAKDRLRKQKKQDRTAQLNKCWKCGCARTVKNNSGRCLFCSHIHVLKGAQLMPPQPAAQAPPVPAVVTPNTNQAQVNLDSLLAAFRQIESNGNYKAVGDNGKAWGAYQFHKARWNELADPKRYGTASNQEQDAAMKKAVYRYWQDATKHGVKDILAWIANWHNLGHGAEQQTAYVQKFKAALGAK